MHLPVFQSVPVVSCPVLGTTRRCLLCSPYQVSICDKMSPEPSLLQVGQPQFSHPFLMWEMLQSPNHLHVLSWTYSRILGEPHTGHSYPDVLNQGWVEWKDHQPPCVGKTPPNVEKNTVRHICWRENCCFLVTLESTRATLSQIMSCRCACTILPYY